MTLTQSSAKTMQIENTTIFHNLQNHKYSLWMKRSTKENITMLLKVLEAKRETIKCQMKSTMKANSQTDSSKHDDRSSTGSYKGKGLKNSKQTSYCSACGEPDHNASKCKIKHKLFCNFCNKQGHALKGGRQNEWTQHMCSLWNQSWKWALSETWTKQQRRSEKFTLNLNRVTQAKPIPQPKSTTKAIWVQCVSTTRKWHIWTTHIPAYQISRTEQKSKFHPSRSSTPVGSPCLDQLNQTAHQNTDQPEGSIHHNGGGWRKRNLQFEFHINSKYSMERTKQNFMSGSEEYSIHVHIVIETYTRNSLRRSTGMVTTVLLKMDAATRAEKIKKKLQEHFWRKTNSTPCI